MNETELIIRESRKIVEALGATLAPLVEVVLHDLTNPDHAVIAIENNLSGRNLGEPATELGLARIVDTSFPEVIQNYSNTFPDGRPAKSTSIGLKNSEGKYVAAICLNVDISALSAAAASLSRLIQIEPSPVEIKESITPPHLKTIQEIILEFAVSRNTTPKTLTPSQRREIIHRLVTRGMMDLKNAQTTVARELGIARSTVYTYLP